MAKTIRIKRKGVLKDILYREAYDKIVIYPNGDWALITNGTVDPNSCYVLSRNYFYDKSHRDIDRIVKYYENLLNGGEDYD
jgi:hypothetical protein